MSTFIDRRGKYVSLRLKHSHRRLLVLTHAALGKDDVTALYDDLGLMLPKGTYQASDRTF